MSSAFNDEYWQYVLSFRDEANRAIEEARNRNVIGASLEANITIYTSKEHAAKLAMLEDELRFVLITSQASVVVGDAPEGAFASENGDFAFVVAKSEHKKCERCWHYEDGVDSDPEYPGLCPRCIENIKQAQGETRKYA